MLLNVYEQDLNVKTQQTIRIIVGLFFDISFFVCGVFGFKLRSIPYFGREVVHSNIASSLEPVVSTSESSPVKKNNLSPVEYPLSISETLSGSDKEVSSSKALVEFNKHEPTNYGYNVNPPHLGAYSTYLHLPTAPVHERS